MCVCVCVCVRACACVCVCVCVLTKPLNAPLGQQCRYDLFSTCVHTCCFNFQSIVSLNIIKLQSTN